MAKERERERERAERLGEIQLTVICFLPIGFADLVGRKYGVKNKLPHNRGKSWAGSLAFFFASLISQALYVGLFHRLGWFDVTLAQYAPVMLLVTAVCTVVESLPVEEFDNLTVFVVGLVTNKLMGY